MNSWSKFILYIARSFHDLFRVAGVSSPFFASIAIGTFIGDIILCSGDNATERVDGDEPGHKL